MNSRNIKILITVAVALAGMVFIATQSIGDVDLFADVSQIHQDPDKYLGKKSISVRGYVAAGSIEENVVDQQQHRSFRLSFNGKEILVRHTGAVADTFKDQAETVAKGALARENGQLVLVAFNGDAGIMAKCPSKYEGRR